MNLPVVTCSGGFIQLCSSLYVVGFRRAAGKNMPDSMRCTAKNNHASVQALGCQGGFSIAARFKRNLSYVPMVV